MKISELLESHILTHTKGSSEVAVLMSGGMDSISLAMASHRLGKKVTAYTFKTDTHNSRDYVRAKEICDEMGWDFKGVIVPTNNITKDFFDLLKKLDCVKKTHFECTFPFLYIYPTIREKFVLSGISADGWYWLSKKAMINFRYPKSKFDDFRNKYFATPNFAGIDQQKLLCDKYNKVLIAPYAFDDQIKKFFMDRDWDELNKPKQKRHVREAYAYELDKVGRVKQHMNLQIDARIPQLFEKLLDDPRVNRKKRTRVMDLCKDWQNWKGE